MKNLIRISMIAVLIGLAEIVAAQSNRGIQYLRPVGQDGVNVFEDPKIDTAEFDGIKVRVGGDFALQLQALSQSNDNPADTLVDLGSNFNLPTANLNLDVQLHDGLRMHLRTYLSSRNHPEAWIKGGYLQVDELDFIKEGFLENVMKVTTVRVGLDEFNYGDAHFRRSDNARAIYNPFVGNFIMDAFSTEVFGEVTVQSNGFIGVIGLTNGKLNQSVVLRPGSDNKPSFYGKLGYDSQINDDLRFRLTGSWYINNGTTTGTYLYGGDRAGARYYDVLHTTAGDGSFADPRFNPRFRELTAIQINPFIKFKGLEFFGIYEIANDNSDADGSYTQLAGELLYRFGPADNFYVGGRYNLVRGGQTADAPDREISRLNLGTGWFMTKNIVAKLEYVTQNYDEAGWDGTRYQGAEFDGVVLEAAISF